jgi:hypothetical protein
MPAVSPMRRKLYSTRSGLAMFGVAGVCNQALNLFTQRDAMLP